MIPQKQFKPVPIFKTNGQYSSNNSQSIMFTGLSKIYPKKGYLTYEYNPFRNLRLQYDLYKTDAAGRIQVKMFNRQTSNYDYQTAVLPKLEVNVTPDPNKTNTGILFPTIVLNLDSIKLTSSTIENIIVNNEIYFFVKQKIEDAFAQKQEQPENYVFTINDIKYNVKDATYDEFLNKFQLFNKSAQQITDTLSFILQDTIAVKQRAKSLVDFDTQKLNLSLQNPVDIQIQPSYDGSVNLILNDDLNQPRMINSRFAALENNTFQVCDHNGENDTNIYDNENFETETSLYKLVNKIAKIQFNGIEYGGNNKVGNYVYYFKLADADGNETDFIGESFNVCLFVGTNKDPFSIRGGIRDENSNKIVKFTLSNLDNAYDYVNVYFSRWTSDEDGVPVQEFGFIDSKFHINNGVCDVVITGFEKIIPKSEYDINVSYEIIKSAKTAAQCQNMLFLGNIEKPEVLYNELQDLASRIFPVPTLSSNTIGSTDCTFYDREGKYEYYDVNNIYSKVGYFPNEFYRFGIVFILNNNTLSPVFGIRGGLNLELSDISDDKYVQDNFDNTVDLFDQNGKRQYIQVTDSILNSRVNPLENNKGVVKFSVDHGKIIDDNFSVRPLGVKMVAPFEVIQEIYKYAKGFFFVRQRRIPTVLAQALVIGHDNESYLPSLYDPKEKKLFTESFINSNRVLDHSFSARRITADTTQSNAFSAICPEAEIRESVFSQLFTGEQYVTEKIGIQPDSGTFKEQPNISYSYFTFNKYKDPNATSSLVNTRVTLIQDNVKLKTDSKNKFAARGGEAEEAFRFANFGIPVDWKDKNVTNIVRGSFGTYIGIQPGQYDFYDIIEIKIPGYNANVFDDYFKVRFDDTNAFFPISQRIDLESDVDWKTKKVGQLTTASVDTLFSGDCYTGVFSHRMMRNFQDPETPLNDKFVDVNTWKDNFDPKNPEDLININLGDVNAVCIGHWIAFKLFSNVNLSLRDHDMSYPTEFALTGNPRIFFPINSASTAAVFKVPESHVINGGISKIGSSRYNFARKDVPWEKNAYSTRIMYSDIAPVDSFINNYRVFKINRFFDYPTKFGGITKLVSWQNNLIAVCEHGIYKIVVNEKAVAANVGSGDVYLNSHNVLQDTPLVLSEDFGSQWMDSVFANEMYIYGVDTVAKKIWRINTSGQIEYISDNKIGGFLNENISLGEREFTPFVGIRNVKTVYNAFKRDIIFTFYDNLYGQEEVAWSLCFNEYTETFVTFYSWLPSAMENIDNMAFSFDRVTSKNIAKLSIANKNSVDANGICIDNVIFEKSTFDNKITNGYLISEYSSSLPDKFKQGQFDPSLITVESILPSGDDNPSMKEQVKNLDEHVIIGELDYNGAVAKQAKENGETLLCTYSIETDNFGNHLYFYLVKVSIPIPEDKNKIYPSKYYLAIRPKDVYENDLTYESFLYKEKEYISDKHREPYGFARPVYTINMNVIVDVLSPYHTNKIVTSEADESTVLDRFKLENKGQFNNYITVTPFGNLDIYPEKEEEDSDKDYVIVRPGLTTDFWKHGQAGLIDICETIKPTNWYGKTHPFEFEFIVSDQSVVQKVFNNIVMYANHAEPESFHYEIVGQSYDFADQKESMYFRQELTKEMLQKHMFVDILYDHKYINTKETTGTIKSSMLFPLYYNKVDTFDELYNSYQSMTAGGFHKDYQNLTGSEIVWDKLLNEFKINVHQKGLDVKKYGTLRGNMEYKEDIWRVQIQPINYVQKQEVDTKNYGKKLVLTQIPNYFYRLNNVEDPVENNPYDYDNYKPDGKTQYPKITVTSEFEDHNDVPHKITFIQNDGWSSRHQMKIRDKYMRVRVRYSGKELAVINAISTLFVNSFA